MLPPFIVCFPFLSYGKYFSNRLSLVSHILRRGIKRHQSCPRSAWSAWSYGTFFSEIWYLHAGSLTSTSMLFPAILPAQNCTTGGRPIAFVPLNVPSLATMACLSLANDSLPFRTSRRTALAMQLGELNPSNWLVPA